MDADKGTDGEVVMVHVISKEGSTYPIHPHLSAKFDAFALYRPSMWTPQLSVG